MRSAATSRLYDLQFKIREQRIKLEKAKYSNAGVQNLEDIIDEVIDGLLQLEN